MKYLAGKFFHSFNEKGTTNWQGQIESCSCGYAIVITYDWLLGGPYVRKLVPLEDIVKWDLYDSAEEMTDRYEHELRRRDERIRESGRQAIQPSTDEQICTAGVREEDNDE